MRKTWIKVKRGLLLDPKHRLALGNRIWLYLYILDKADWDTGKVVHWIDRAAADDMQMPISTIRTQRREIEEAGYISCHQNKRSQTITIIKWVNPREYSGKVYNFEDSDQEYEPTEDESESEKIKGDNKGEYKGDNKGTHFTTPLHINHISQVTGQYASGEIDLFEACARVYEKLKGKLVTDPSSFALMISNFKKHGTTPEDYAGAIIAMANDPKYKRAEKPTSFEKYALGITEKRLNPVTIDNNGHKKDDYPEFDIVYDENGIAYNAKGEVINA